MDDVRPEIKQALQEMNWEARLKEARAKRRALEEERLGTDPAAASAPIVTSIDMVEKMRFGSVSEPESAAPVAGSFAERWRKKPVLIGLGVLSGAAALALGLYSTSVEGTLGNPNTVAAPDGQTGLNAAETAAIDRPAPLDRPEPNLPEVGPPPRVTGQLPAALVAPGLSALPQGPVAVAPHGRIALAPASLNPPRADRAPNVGSAPAPRIALIQTSMPAPVDSLLDSETKNLSEIAKAWPGPTRLASAGKLHDDQRLPALLASVATDPVLPVVAPERPILLTATAKQLLFDPSQDATATPGIALASIASDPLAKRQSLRIPSAPPQGTAPLIDERAPDPVIIGAKDMTIRIFAASSVDDDAVTTTEDIVGRYGLALRAVTRVGYRISQDQVRFYDTTTAAAAARLADDIGAIARDFAGANNTPPAGTLEIYLAGEASEPAPTPPVARPTQPVRRPALSATDRLRASVLSRLRSGAASQ